MTKWEYMIDYYDVGFYSYAEIKIQLNALGRIGWELVSTFLHSRYGGDPDMVCILKRKVE